MEILEGLLFINDIDVYVRFGAFLTEDKPGDTANYSALLKPSPLKTTKPVNFREENGEKYPEELTPASEARDVTLYFAIAAESGPDFMKKYEDFIKMLKSGWLNIRLPELTKVFRMFYVSCSEYSQLTALNDGRVAARFKVKFREPSPSF